MKTKTAAKHTQLNAMLTSCQYNHTFAKSTVKSMPMSTRSIGKTQGIRTTQKHAVSVAAQTSKETGIKCVVPSSKLTDLDVPAVGSRNQYSSPSTIPAETEQRIEKKDCGDGVYTSGLKKKDIPKKDIGFSAGTVIADENLGGAHMKNKFTPGPWFAYDEKLYKGHHVAGRTPQVLGGEDGTDRVASVVHMADARLIAAAPDMLSALKSLVYSLVYSHDGFEIANSFPAFSMARAAIAKAEVREVK